MSELELRTQETSYETCTIEKYHVLDRDKVDDILYDE